MIYATHLKSDGPSTLPPEHHGVVVAPPDGFHMYENPRTRILVHTASGRETSFSVAGLSQAGARAHVAQVARDLEAVARAG